MLISFISVARVNELGIRVGVGPFGGSLGVSIIAIKATKSWMTNF